MFFCKPPVGGPHEGLRRDLPIFTRATPGRGRSPRPGSRKAVANRGAPTGAAVT